MSKLTFITETSFVRLKFKSNQIEELHYCWPAETDGRLLLLECLNCGRLSAGHALVNSFDGRDEALRQNVKVVG